MLQIQNYLDNIHTSQTNAQFKLNKFALYSITGV
nr:MAG TPA: hypothetical protein [Caudoviricetes sp.]